MSHNWDTSRRRKDPPYWPQLRRQVIDRAKGLCEHIEEADVFTGQPTACTYPGTDVDHIVNLANGGTDDIGNLQLLCTWHHKQKTSREAQANRRPVTERHPREQHPGFN